MRRNIRLFAGFAIALAGFGGLYFAESRSLPGDPLYAVKTRIDEPLLALESSFNAEARTYVAAAQAEARLQEAERLFAAKRLDATMTKQLTMSFNERSAAAIQGIDDLASANAEAGASITSLFMSGLSAHATVLQGMPGAEAAMLLSYVTKAQASLEIIGNRTTRALVSGRARADMESVAGHAIDSAASEIASAQHRLSSVNGMHAAAGQELQLSVAVDALTTAKAQQDAKAFVDAFNLALRARAQAHAAGIVTDAARY